jgi:AhpD family alkylhydroperoxidase
MTRVPLVASSALPLKYAGIYEEFGRDCGPLRNQAAVLAHVPPALEHLSKLLLELKARQGLKPRHLDLALLTTSKLNACGYCVAHHAPKLGAEGLARAAVDQLPLAEHPVFDPVACLVIAYARHVTEAPGRIPEATFERLRQHFSAAEIVELTLRIALTGAYNRLSEALLLESEQEILAPAAAAAK